MRVRVLEHDGGDNSGTTGTKVLVAALLAGLAFVLQLAFASPGSAATGNLCPQTGMETISTDRSDYAPGSLVHISGTGYAPGCDIVVKVTRPDGLVVTGDGLQTPGSDTVTTDPFGEFSYDYQLQSVPAVEGQYLVDALGAGDAVLAHTEFGDAATVQLYLDAVHTNEDYVFERGATVFASGTGLLNNRFYKLEVFDPNGVSKHITPACTPDTAGSSSDSYTTLGTDPLSTNLEWKYVLHQYTNSTCTNLQSDSTATFDVARATAFADSGLTTARSAFNAGASAFVKVEGVQPGKSNWNATWVLPSSATACANTLANDRPDSAANGTLPAPASAPNNESFLQYQPAGASAWNVLANYDGGGPCPALASGNQGTWKLQLGLDGTHFVTLTAFSVDTTPPTVTINQAGTQFDPTTGSMIHYAAVFSEPITGFTSSDVSITGTAAGTKSVTVTQIAPNDGTTYDVSVAGMSSRGTVVASIAAAGASDAAGNGNTASTSTDNTVTWDRLPSAGVTLDDHSPRTNDVLTATASPSDPDGDSVTLTYVWRVNGTTRQTTVTTSTTDTFNLATAGFGSKGDTVSVTVTPNDGLFDGSSATDSALVANAPPTVTLSGANGLNVNEGSTHTYSYTISDADVDSIASISTSCGANGTKSNASNSDTSGSFDCTFPDGPAGSTVSAQATDTGFGAAAGNTATQIVTVNNVAPTVALTSAPASANEGETKHYAYSIGDPGQDTIQSVATSCGINGTESNPSNSDTSGSFDCSFPDGPASSTVSVQATDSDGDAGNTATQVVTVANVAPTVSLSGADHVDEGTTHTYSFSVSDPGQDSFSVDAGFPTCGSGGSYVSGSLTTEATGGSFDCSFPDGPATTDVKFKVTDSDGASDTGSEAVQVVQVANVDPTVTAANEQSSDEGSSHAFELGSFSDPGPDANWTVSVDWGDGSSATTFTTGSTGSLGTKPHTYVDGPNDYTVTVTVTDKDGGSGSAGFQEQVDNVAPTVALTSAPASANEGETKHYAYSIGDPGQDTIQSVATSCGVNGTESNASNSDTSGSFDCSFPDGPASSTVSVQATDSDGDAGNTATQVVTVANVVPSTPNLLSPADNAFTNDSTPTFAWSDSTDPGVDTIAYSIQAALGSCDFSGALALDESGLSSSDFTPSTALGDGTYCWRAKATDSDGADSSASSTHSVTIDTAAPNSTITLPANGGSYQSPAFDSGCGTAAGDICGTANDDRSGAAEVETSIRQDSTGWYWNGTSFAPGPESYVTVSGTTSWSYNFGAPPEGSYTIHSRATDNAGNVETTTDAAHFNEVAFVIDNTSPDVTIDQASGQADPTNASPIHFTAVFSEPVHDFGSGNVSLSGSAGATTATVTDSSNHKTYDVAVSGMTNDGTVIVSIASAAAHDAAGNASTASTSTDNTVIYDTTKPDVTIDQASGQADPTNASPIHFTAVFSEPTGGFGGDDVSLSGSANPGLAVVTDSGDQKTYDVAVGGMTSDGTVIASIPAGGATDLVGNGNTASTSTDNTVTYDTAAPDVTIDQGATQSDPTNASPIHFTAVFSKPVTGFTPGDVTIAGSAGGSKTVTISGGPSTYDVAVTGMTDGTVIATITPGGASDAAGNGNSASTSTDNSVTCDKARPSVTTNQGASQTDPTSTAPIHFTAVFSEPVTGFGNSSVTLGGTAGGSLSAGVTQIAPNNDTTYEVKVTGMTTAGTVIATIGASKAHDPAGNDNTASTSIDNTVTWQPTLGNTTPVVTILQPAFGSVYAKGSAAINPLTLKASFTDPDNGPWTWYVNWDDGTPNSSGVASASGSTFQATHSYSSPGVYTINVNAKDSAGAVGTAQVWIVVYDPNGGFVTGGGWLNVGAGSYTADPTLSGRGNFGFNSQYKKNANVPSGETEFNFQVGNFDFHSSAQSWLVVNGFKAQYRGTGTVNGGGSYDFTLTAYDCDINGGGGVDKFRIRITDNNNSNRVVFDNRNGAPSDIDTADPQAIAGGSIVIHKA